MVAGFTRCGHRIGTRNGNRRLAPGKERDRATDQLFRRARSAGNTRPVGIRSAGDGSGAEHDAADATAEVDGALPWSGSLDAARRAVLVNMAFNMGLGVHGQSGLLGFARMLAAVERGDYDRAAAEMMDSRWARQVGPRAHRRARQMQTGEWQ